MTRTRRILAGAGAGLAVALLASALLGAAAAAPQAPTQVRVLIVRDGFVLSRDTVPRGVVVFTVVNRDTLAHDFSIPSGGKTVWVGKTPVLAPHQRFVLRVRFRARGRYDYYSSLPEQSELGFAGQLLVR
jgi:plastocyanin